MLQKGRSSWRLHLHLYFPLATGLVVNNVSKSLTSIAFFIPRQACVHACIHLCFDEKPSGSLLYSNSNAQIHNGWVVPTNSTFRERQRQRHLNPPQETARGPASAPAPANLISKACLSGSLPSIHSPLACYRQPAKQKKNIPDTGARPLYTVNPPQLYCTCTSWVSCDLICRLASLSSSI